MPLKGSGLRKCQKCGAAIRWDAPKSRTFCNACSKILDKSGKAFLERGHRLNSTPTVDVPRSVVDADVVTEHECRCCHGPHEGSHNTGYFCETCKRERILDIHKEIDRRNEKLLMERQAQDREYYKTWKEEQKKMKGRKA